MSPKICLGEKQFFLISFRVYAIFNIKKNWKY